MSNSEHTLRGVPSPKRVATQHQIQLSSRLGVSKESSTDSDVHKDAKKIFVKLNQLRKKTKGDPEKLKVVEAALELVRTYTPEGVGTNRNWWTPSYGFLGTLEFVLEDFPSYRKKETERLSDHPLLREFPQYKMPPKVGWDRSFSLFYEEDPDEAGIPDPQGRWIKSRVQVAKILKSNGWKDSTIKGDPNVTFLEKDGEVLTLQKGQGSGVSRRLIPWWEYPESKLLS